MEKNELYIYRFNYRNFSVSKKTLSHREIWNNAVKLHIEEKVDSTRKTPWVTLGERMYTDIKDNQNTPSVQVSKRPAKYVPTKVRGTTRVKGYEDKTFKGEMVC